MALPKLPSFRYWEWPVQVVVVSLVCVLTWPKQVSLRPVRWAASIGIGALVFCLWIGPEWLNPQYRHYPLFSNMLFGQVGSSLHPDVLRSNWVLFWRTFRSATVVPVAEELFWRAWLMRWFIDNDFEKVRLGAYAPLAFWLTTVLFALEHGPYWDVGFLTGMIYNLWMIRSKSVGDCILMHAVTNLLLSLYVVAYGQWQFWQ